MKRKLTPEQEAARDARREKFKALAKQVSEMSDAQRAELVNGVGAVVTCEGRALSMKNTCLLFLQSGGTVSMVGGFRQWIKAGRCVQKGQRGMMIWVKCGGKEDGTEDGEDGPRFVTGTVFDITQTAELTAEPVATVAPEIAEAFGMSSLPNVRTVEAEELALA